VLLEEIDFLLKFCWWIEILRLCGK